MSPSTSIRVLVVDDSALIRRVVVRALSADPQIEVVGTAFDGRAGIEALERQEVDLVTLDIEMPRMNGLETLRAIRRRWPRLPVIMFSTLTYAGGAATLEALASGASDYVTKPSGNSLEAATAEVQEHLLPRVKALCARRVQPAGQAAPAVSLRPPSATAPVRVIGVAVSTGGPAALERLFAMLPATLPVPVLVVQHMPPTFTQMLAERLDKCSPLTVREATEGAQPRPGEAWIARGGRHMLAERSGGAVRLKLGDGPPENSCKPAADTLLRSLAAAYGPEVLALVLTGMGQDGLKGAKAVVAAGGRVLAQDEATSVVWGMPGLVAKAGIAEAVLPLDEMAAALTQRATATGRASIARPSPVPPGAGPRRIGAIPPANRFGSPQETVPDRFSRPGRSR
ncbi:MAG: chemotaxis response regulator protein-glutamate methylesterase [Actinomycetota bacterium]|nr:chemotaxis response regulator protein-glutamate methylesterase [Actinomycetota bacterium]